MDFVQFDLVDHDEYGFGWVLEIDNEYRVLVEFIDPPDTFMTKYFHDGRGYSVGIGGSCWWVRPDELTLVRAATIPPEQKPQHPLFMIMHKGCLDGVQQQFGPLYSDFDAAKDRVEEAARYREGEFSVWKHQGTLSVSLKMDWN